MHSSLRSIFPESWINAYHFALAELAAFWYGHPSKGLVVIGVTGTKGKTSTAILLSRLLEAGGATVGLTSTVGAKIGKRELPNPSKRTMPGRFELQRLLRKMKNAGCTHMVIETSSEGILQHRHRGIFYDMAVFTNLSPEHIRRHGSYEAYRSVKGELFRSLTEHMQTRTNEREIPRTTVTNGDDPEAEFFLQFPADEKYAFGFDPERLRALKKKFDRLQTVLGEDLKTDVSGSSFTIQSQAFKTPLPGRMNAYNALAAATAAWSAGMSTGLIQKTLPTISLIPGRMERIEAGQPFSVIVDYAHEPKSFQSVFDAAALLSPKKAIAIFGAVGGGRDFTNRAEMGRIAARHATHTILTTDDPYEDDPVEIARDIAKGFEGTTGSYEIIADRREAIRKALKLAQPGSLVLLLGMGGGTTMQIGGRTIPWDDREVAKEEIGLLS